MQDITTAEIAQTASRTRPAHRVPRAQRLGLKTIPDLETRRVALVDMGFRRDRDTKTNYMKIDGEEFVASNRFRDSVLGQVGQGASIFDLFEFDEVMNRHVEKHPKRTELQLTVDRTSGIALGVASTNRTVLSADRLRELIEKFDFTYHEGVLITNHEPNSEYQRDLPVLINGDEHRFRFHMDAPLDGYGNPNFSVGMLRQICSNGMVAMTTAFRRPANLPKTDDKKAADPYDILSRMLSTYTIGEESTEAIQKRMEAAASTPASIHEFQSLRRLMHGMSASPAITRRLGRYENEICDHYGVTGLSVWDTKPAQRTRTEHSVYDLVNMATEAATHFGTGGFRLHGWVGSLITKQYDLEGLGMSVSQDSPPFHFLPEEDQIALVA